MGKRKRRTKAEMESVEIEKKKSDKISEKIEKGELTDKEIILDALPKQKEKEYIYIDKPVEVIKEVRILKEREGTEMSITDIVKKELDHVNIWEYKNVPINEFSIKDLTTLGKEGWKYAFDISPSVSNSVKITTLIFQRAKK